MEAPEQTEAPAQPDKITLTIQFDPATQQISVNGPIHNRMFCYGLLTLAEKAIDEAHAKNAKKAIVPAHGFNGAHFRR